MPSKHRIAVMQPYFLPYIGYFQLIHSVDKFIVFDDVDYIKKGWINRNRMLYNGQALVFTVPLKSASQNQLICNTQIDETTKWRERLMKTFTQSYAAAPFRSEVLELLGAILKFRGESISDFNVNSIRAVCKYLTLDTNIQDTSTTFNNQELKGEVRILDICKSEDADVYINSIGGVKLYKQSNFQQLDINLCFLKSLPLLYKQKSDHFVSHLSIVDTLMYNPKSAVKAFLTNYELISSDSSL